MLEHRIQQREFLSTPSARRATHHCPERSARRRISIHALREEGDGLILQTRTMCAKFLSTPSARRATQLLPKLWLFDGISIHALREEGDEAFMEISLHKTISIHALREEGDRRRCRETTDQRYFYPRPPRGGRPASCDVQPRDLVISIHALREEGDPFRV